MSKAKTHRTVKVYFDLESWQIIENQKIYGNDGNLMSRSQKIRFLIKNKMGAMDKSNYPVVDLMKWLNRWGRFMSDGILESQDTEIYPYTRVESKAVMMYEALVDFRAEVRALEALEFETFKRGDEFENTRRN